MVKRFKVWTYREGDPPLFHSGPLNNIYAIEGQFIDEMDSNKSPFRARHPDEAHVFFLPLSVTGVVHYVYRPITSVKDYSRDRLQRLVTDYIDTVSTKYPYWNRSNGADHFMVSCHDWVSFEPRFFPLLYRFRQCTSPRVNVACFSLLQAPEVSNANPELFKHFIRVVCNANTSEGFRPKIDVSLPEIYLPFGKLGPPNLSRGPDHRTVLAFFAGSPHGYIREILLNHWKEKDSEVQVYARLPKNLNYTKMMGQSKFCLCPSGFEVASPREVEAIYAGCVPVVISDNYTLPFSDVLNWSQFSVQIPVGEIPEIKRILQGIPESKYLKMYKRVKRVRRHFKLNRPAKPFDVIHMKFAQHFELLQRACIPDHVLYPSNEESTTHAPFSTLAMYNDFKDAQRIAKEVKSSFSNDPDRLAEIRKLEQVAEHNSVAQNLICRIGALDPPLNVSFELSHHPFFANVVVKRS
ncbi:Heptahelical transmembrane protein1 isoform 1 [Hibiscus syriacus]|uniref:Heptahelical transmembrane protein1 isoform 1 n=1 Tax=Hibiscus syriacus TaxID=106335 RepID=A0A6A2Z6A2_HIBSY|nr:Heptahelical transmembrane protein1 isoform 1 [Hibiscus syriacus]